MKETLPQSHAVQARSTKAFIANDRVRHRSSNSLELELTGNTDGETSPVTHVFSLPSNVFRTSSNLCRILLSLVPSPFALELARSSTRNTTPQCCSRSRLQTRSTRIFWDQTAEYYSRYGLLENDILPRGVLSTVELTILMSSSTTALPMVNIRHCEPHQLRHP
jgi:hypothetical protein